MSLYWLTVAPSSGRKSHLLYHICWQNKAFVIWHSEGLPDYSPHRESSRSHQKWWRCRWWTDSWMASYCDPLFLHLNLVFSDSRPTDRRGSCRERQNRVCQLQSGGLARVIPWTAQYSHSAFQSRTASFLCWRYQTLVIPVDPHPFSRLWGAVSYMARCATLCSRWALFIDVSCLSFVVCEDTAPAQSALYRGTSYRISQNTTSCELPSPCKMYWTVQVNYRQRERQIYWKSMVSDRSRLVLSLLSSQRLN